LKGKRQLDAESELALLRQGVNDHVALLSEAVSRLRLYVRQTESLVSPLSSADSELRMCLAKTRGEIDLVYDTMVRVRWAALGVRPQPEPTNGQSGSAHGEGGETVSEQKPIIYVVDDNPSVRKALSRLFRSINYDAEVFASAKQFLQAEPDGHPACVVLDVRMPRMSGLDLQHELTNLESDLPIIFITGHGDIDMAVRAMKDGAVDFLPKPFDDQDLLDSVERALQHHREIRVVSDRREEISERMARLTPREQEVFERVIKGMLNKQIGYELGTTEKTIKVHRARVMEKMEAESLADLVRMAGRMGIEGPTPEEDS
jgi:FixJ family two-component response regulator